MAKSTYINDVHGGGEHISLCKVGKLLIDPNRKDPILVSSLQIQNSANPQEVFANPSSLMSSVILFFAEAMCILICPPYVTTKSFWGKGGLFAGPQSCILLHVRSWNAHVCKRNYLSAAKIFLLPFALSDIKVCKTERKKKNNQ